MQEVPGFKMKTVRDREERQETNNYYNHIEHIRFSYSNVGFKVNEACNIIVIFECN